MTPIGTQKDLVLFVHGFGSSSKCWKPMLELLQGDDRVMARYEFVPWDYPTKWVELNLLGRIPRLEEIGRSLEAEIDSPRYRGRRVTLVGHSQGGLVIQRYIAALLDGRGSQLRDVEQAIFFATPCEGSTTGMSLRRLFSSVFTNPQEMTLRVLNPDVSDLLAIIRARIVNATTDSNVSWRVPIHAFCGLQDNIVPEASARGVFDNIKSVKGTHFSIIQPSDRLDARYAEFVELLLEPGGHAHRFDVETYECVVRVEPRQPPQSIRTASEKNPRTVTFDNYATQTRTVRFSPANRCKDKFKFSYRTRKEGYVIGHPSHHNEASPADIGLGEDTGMFYEFDFTPEAGNEYRLKVEVYRGFDEDNRNIHYHLGNDSRYGRVIYVLDLSAYIVGQYVVTEGPHFYLAPTDVGHSELCNERGARDPLEPVSRTPDGIFRWELEHVEQGVVDIVWDVARLDAALVATAGVASAQIADGRIDPSPQ